MDYSLADVVGLTGGKRRSIQLWAEAGAILAYPRTEKRGTGTHRRFSRDEVIIACCLNGLARRQIGIGELVRIGVAIRDFLNTGGPDRQAFEEVVGQKREAYLGILWPEEAKIEVFFLNESFVLELYELDGQVAVLLPLRENAF